MMDLSQQLHSLARDVGNDYATSAPEDATRLINKARRGRVAWSSGVGTVAAAGAATLVFGGSAVAAVITDDAQVDPAGLATESASPSPSPSPTASASVTPTPTESAEESESPEPSLEPTEEIDLSDEVADDADADDADDAYDDDAYDDEREEAEHEEAEHSEDHSEELGDAVSEEHDD